ncbi:MAG: outer membrane beta-barrel protein [Verrucomicrobiota bacterium]
MKKIFVSAGLVAAGIAGLQPALAAGPDLISSKAWNVSGSLRGFYDDNYNISGSGKGSFGVQVMPTISLHVPMQQTDFGMRYTYGLYYYQDRDQLGLNPFDHSHQLNVWLDHAFNTRWKANITDTVAMGQEPELLGRTTGGLAIPYRVSGNNIANHATASLNTEWTRLFSTSLSYGNSFYDYDDKGTILFGAAPTPIFPPQFPVLQGNTPGIPGFSSPLSRSPSYAGLLNRVEQNASLDLQWHFRPETMGFVGYNFSWVNYIGNEPIGVFNYYKLTLLPVPTLAPKSVVYRSDSRDAYSQYAYVGVQHQFNANLSGSIKGGVSYTDSYNDPMQSTTSLAPYADLSLSYTYIPGSYVQFGFTQDLNATDMATVNSATGSLTQYQESSVFYASLNHKINPRLLGTIIGRCQYSTAKGGAGSNVTDTDVGLGVNLRYQFSTHFSADIGYNFDNLTSGFEGRTYSRNRVYAGFGANY